LESCAPRTRRHFFFCCPGALTQTLLGVLHRPTVSFTLRTTITRMSSGLIPQSYRYICLHPLLLSSGLTWDIVSAGRYRSGPLSPSPFPLTPPFTFCPLPLAPCPTITPIRGCHMVAAATITVQVQPGSVQHDAADSQSRCVARGFVRRYAIRGPRSQRAGAPMRQMNVPACVWC